MFNILQLGIYLADNILSCRACAADVDFLSFFSKLSTILHIINKTVEMLRQNWHFCNTERSSKGIGVRAPRRLHP